MEKTIKKRSTKINNNFLYALIISVFITLASLFLFLSWHGSYFSWMYWAKNYTFNSTILPIFGIMSGVSATVTSGNLFQYTTRNNLASPFTLGIMPAATTAGMILRIFNGIINIYLNFILAIIIALVILAIIFIILGKNIAGQEMIIIGISFGLGLIALNYLLSTQISGSQLTFRWFSSKNIYPTKEKLIFCASIIWPCILISFLLAKKLTIYKRNPKIAQVVGIKTKPLLIASFILGLMLSIAALILIGEMAFIGIAIPNITRIILKSDNLSINIILGITISISLGFIAAGIAQAFVVSANLVITIIAAPLFIIALFLRRAT